MGYRYYIGSLEKKEYEKIKNFDKEQLFSYKEKDTNEGDAYISVSDIPSKVLHEFGKYCDFDSFHSSIPVFEDEGLQEYFTKEHHFYLVDKEFLEKVIKYYSDSVLNFYSNFIKNIDSGDDNKKNQALHELVRHTKYKIDNFRDGFVYDLSEKEYITDCWILEYVIFEIVRIYKSFDFGNNVMIFYAW